MTITHIPKWLEKTGVSSKNIWDNLDQLGLQQHYWQEKVAFPRLTAWFSSKQSGYAYSGQVAETAPFPDILAPVLAQLRTEFGEDFNSCLANYYRNGNDHVSWHKDREEIFPKGSMIASVSIGATRKFQLKKEALLGTGKPGVKDVDKFEYILSDGDLFLFNLEHKEDWVHRIPKESKVMEPRLNLTFRIAKM